MVVGGKCPHALSRGSTSKSNRADAHTYRSSSRESFVRHIWGLHRVPAGAIFRSGTLEEAIVCIHR
jgi:hypothetical protein